MKDDEKDQSRSDQPQLRAGESDLRGDVIILSVDLIVQRRQSDGVVFINNAAFSDVQARRILADLLELIPDDPSWFHELDKDASVLEAASKRVRVALSKGTLFAVLGVGCIYLHRAHWTATKLRKRISSANVVSPEHRTIMKEVAQNLGQATVALEQGLAEFRKMDLSRIPIVGQKYLSLLEDLICTSEDMAETAALGGSPAFARLVRKDVRTHVDEHHKRQVKTEGVALENYG